MHVFRLLVVLAFFSFATACHPSGLTLGGKSIRETFSDASEQALVEAAVAGDSKTVRRLAGQHVNVNALSSSGATPLMWAVHARNLQGIRTLLDVGADPNQRSRQGFLVMESVSVSDEVEILRLLLDHGGDPNLPASGYSPTGSMLGNAATEGKLENVELLLEHGADIAFEDEKGATAVDYAIVGGWYNVALFLLQSGYTKNLEDVAASTQTRLVSEDREPDRQKVIKWLKSHGVKYPAYEDPEPELGVER